MATLPTLFLIGFTLFDLKQFGIFNHHWTCGKWKFIIQIIRYSNFFSGQISTSGCHSWSHFSVNCCLYCVRGCHDLSNSVFPWSLQISSEKRRRSSANSRRSVKRHQDHQSLWLNRPEYFCRLKVKSKIQTKMHFVQLSFYQGLLFTQFLEISVYY